MNRYSKLALFGSGILFGTIGVKILGSRDAKKAYVHATACGLRVKDTVMQTVTNVQENAADIVASAKEINARKAAEEANALEEAQIADMAESTEENQSE